MTASVETRAPVYRIQLTDAEVHAIQQLTAEIAARYASVEERAFMRAAPTYAQELPRSLRAQLNEFRLGEPAGLCLLSGYPIDDARIGPTPAHWKNKPTPSPTLSEDLYFFLCAALLGDPIGWCTQQDGYIMHDIMPIKGHEQEQLGSGSEVLLTWHVEDAFHPYRGDYLGMMCLRNPDRVPTTFAPIKKVRLTPGQLAVLSSAHFTIRPDESHLPRNRGTANGRSAEEEAVVQRAYRKIEQMWSQPEKIPVLFGDPKAPYIRLDPYFMDDPEDPVARETFHELTRQIDGALEDQVLEPGDFCFIDNFQAVHGRKPFKARYDGRDRWLKRINVVRDLRKSRESRLSATSRVLY